MAGSLRRVRRRSNRVVNVRQSVFYRDPDRPDSRYVKPCVRVPPEVKKAKARLRTARYRSDLDRKRRPTTHDIGMSMAVALATTSNLRGLTGAELDLFERA